MKDFITQQVKEVGLGIAAFCLMSWMVVTITTDMVKSIDKTNVSIDRFTVRVDSAHEKGIENQVRLMEQHKGIMTMQKEITTTLSRINGYTEH